MADNFGSHTGTPVPTVAFPPFQTDTFASQLIWLSVSFALLYALVAKFGLARIGAILEERRAHIANDFAEADRHKAESHRVMDDYDGALTHARSRAEGLIGRSQQKVKFEAARERDKFQKGVKKRLIEADSAIGKAKQTATTNIRMIAVETASDVVTQLVGRTPEKNVVFDAVDGVLKR